MDYQKLEKDLKVLSDKVRLQVLHLIFQGERCGCDLLQSLDITQPTLSHHLKVLSEAGYIMGTKTAQKIHYIVNEEKIIDIRNQLGLLLISEKTC